jgi:hypothetical protein
MESSNESLNNEITFYISIISGMLLTISETLPYIKSIQGNGIIELLVNFLIKKSNTQSSNAQNTTSSIDERTPLHPEFNSQVSNFTINSPNITLTFNSPNKITTKTNDLQDSLL